MFHFISCCCFNQFHICCLQDFPPKAAGAAAAVSEFESCLSDYLAALKLPGLWAGDVARLVAAADFSAARAALLPSVPGYHAGVHFVPTMLFVLCGFVLACTLRCVWVQTIVQIVVHGSSWVGLHWFAS